MWRDELQSPPATRRSISSPTLNMKAIPGSCTCCCGDHALHHRSGRDAVLRLAIALGVWVLIWRLSPFRPVVLGAFRGQPALRERAARLRLCGAASSPPRALPAMGAAWPALQHHAAPLLRSGLSCRSSLPWSVVSAQVWGSGCRSCRLTFLTDPVSQLLPIFGGGSGNLLLQAAGLALPILALLTGKIEVFDLKIYLAIDRLKICLSPIGDDKCMVLDI